MYLEKSVYNKRTCLIDGHFFLGKGSPQKKNKIFYDIESKGG